MNLSTTADAPRLVDQLASAPFALVFSGQGYAWLPTLAAHLPATAVAAAVNNAVGGAAQLLAPLAQDLAPFFPHGFDPVAWTRQQPAGIDLSASAVSTPGIVVAQLAVVESLRAQGLPVDDAAVVLGHSQGQLATGLVRGQDPAQVVAVAQLIGAAITRVSREHALVRTAAGAPMVAVRGASREELEAAGGRVGLRNGQRQFVLVGTPQENAAVRRQLEGREADLEFSPLDIQCAYHHPAQAQAVELVQAWGKQVGLDADFVATAARAVLTDFVDWPAQVHTAVEAGVRWILECGPSGGVHALTRAQVEGRGIGTLVVCGAQGQAELFDAGRAPQAPRSWEHLRPRLLRKPDGTLGVSTRFTQVTGYSPVMLPGMTPTTVDPAIVAAAANAGHWAELAGGGQTTPEILQANLERLGQLLEPGVEAQFNAMYLSASQWRRHIEGTRAVPKARANGAPINGVVVSAGIPPREEAIALVRQLQADNFPWVAFKPGTVRQIEQVLEIADAVDVPIIMQVEGGHAGGHHSWEDLDELLLETYARIRQRENVLLAVGGGIGTPERGAHYLLGTWAQAHGRPDMPVDAIMVGTAAMAAAESTASASVKQALVAATGRTDNGGWAPSGQPGAHDWDVVSSRSQLGADIHELENSWSRAGRLLDQLAGDAAAISQHREEIIAAINTTAKPYFGDVESMSYRQWLARYVELSYRGSWVDASWAQRFEQMVQRTEARLHAADHGQIELQVAVDTQDPQAAIADLERVYGAQRLDVAVHVADAAWFITLLSGPGKPANFVPVIDVEVRRWWRQDSLWQAHDERYDADTVSIIPGTIAVAGIERADEPVAQLLGRFEAEAAAHLEGEELRVDAREAIERAPSVSWAGHLQPNPVRLGLPGAQLRAEGEGFVLDVPLDGAGQLSIPMAAPTVPGAAPVVSTEAAAQAMRELARIAAGGVLPEVTAGRAQWRAELTPQLLAAYDNVTAGYVPADAPSTAADVLAGTAWPAVFALIAAAEVDAGPQAVEGLLNLVHLEHHVVVHAPLPQSAQLEIAARLEGVADTPLGRVISIAVDIAADGKDLASLEERFAIRGRRGDAPLPAAQEREVLAKPASHRHRVVLNAPQSMEPFAIVTGDRNPIHVSAAAAALAGLPDGVIVHGMWTSAVAQLAAAFDGARVESWDATMLAPVLPGAELTIDVVRTGVAGNAGEVRTVTATVDGAPVLEATATVSAPRTFYGFPGQGIQSPGMGMEAFAHSAAARAVWERADRHTRSALGFSILDIVRTNPPAVVVDGEEFAHPQGALYLTQFTQVAMATLGCAQIAELAEAGVCQSGAYFAGHSVGEYNALAAYAQVLSLESVLEIVYRRGLTMHRLVERDAEGNSNYGLAALRPNKMGLGAAEVFDFVADLAARTGEFLEIVNYNIAGVQYAVAGTRAGLNALAAEAESRAPGQRAFIQIPGIDVPFHSSHLLDGVPAFREHLDALIPAEIDLDVLEGRYVPNLVARPFSVDREFVESIAQVVDSPVIEQILADFPTDRVAVGRTLLIELLAWQFASPVRWIETQDLLLSNQPDGLGVERFVEVGVGASPTLANMLGQTLRLPQYVGHPIEVLNVERDRVRVFAEDAVEAPLADAPLADAASTAPDSASAPEPAAASEPPVAPTADPAPAAAPAPDNTPAPAAAAGSTPADLALSAADATRMLVAVWTKVRPDQMGATDSIEALVEGVSSRRNQLLLDLGTEFGLGAIDGAADAALDDLAATVSAQAKGYRAFGPVLSEQVAQTLHRLTGPAGKKPAYVAQRITETWGLGPGWVDRVTAELVLGTREGASLRGGDLATLATGASSATELDELIDAAVTAAGQRAGVDIARPAQAAAAAVVDSAALGEFAGQLTGALATTARTLLRELGVDTPQAADDAVTDTALAELVSRELGADWAQQVAPVFDARRAVLLDDRWASAREDVVRVATGALESTDVLGAGEAVAQLAEFYGLDDLARDARTPRENLTRHGQVAVVTGGSPRSIAFEVIGELLAEGATVIATTSRLDHARLEAYKELYRTRAAGAGALWVVPANLSSFADVEALVSWIGTQDTATVGGKSVLLKPALVPDLLFPFAAPRVAGTLADAGAGAELQMRLLLWSVEKLIAGLSALGADTHVGHRLHVVLPGSPNRGRFGGDGAYGESKAALDALVTRWNAEPVWAQRTSLAHAHIGWVRGTGLMGGNDPMVELVEAKGVQTFFTQEMATYLVDQAAGEDTRAAAASEPVILDFTGGLGQAELNLPELARQAAETSQAAHSAESAQSAESADAPKTAALPSPRQPLAWTTPDFSGVTQSLEDMVVIVGAGELGPLGSSRTRYEVELGGDLSAAGVVELAWTTGLIEWDGATRTWRTVADQEPLAEEDIYERFHDQVLAGLGVRRYHDDFGPHMPMVDNLAPELTTIYLERDLTFAVQDEATAQSFVDSVEGTTATFDGQEWQVTRPAGSPVRVPRRVAMSRFVGGQIPQGFDPAVYGIPADMIDNLDRVALWNIVCTVDAFLSAGFSPAELLAHVHPARVSSTQGTGMGGMASLRSLYVDKLLAQARPNDILQEALPNVVAAHVMQSYVGGYGQMVHPVAACATAAVSVEEAMDKLRLHKADFVVAGGIDDLSIEGITGFGDMAATADSAEMEAKGIEHKYFSRANDRRRGGFIESEGGGTLLLARGSLAVELGLPVLGVVGFAESFADGAHTSIPAPGLGALSAARGGVHSQLAASLARLGVSPDEVAIVSKHDTSTNANDPNESDLHERIAAALGRSAGNPLFVISQKTLTGHAKGGAAAFQLVGLTQVLREGIIPPNRSLDCVDPVLRQHPHLTWLRQPLDLRDGDHAPKAGLVTSLGFGHVSALVAVVHPGAFLAAVSAQLSDAAASSWLQRSQAREAAGLRRIDAAMHGGAALYERPVDRNLGATGSAAKEVEAAVLLSDSARLRDGRLQAD
ncbi:type I polyketide synthase [Corynebacterium lizhenjunii]|uniref:type I polyketide synthase n=1 Tax=Corynebacterium lizhenjunii TaxID=2709394 RepID=UPI0013EC4695|nr:type I polyketide synthase [Corynebacterium lizhenjunii]